MCLWGVIINKSLKGNKMFRLLKFLIKFILFCVVIVALLGLYARYVEPYRLVTSHITVENPYATEDIGDIKIAVFSDTHFRNTNTATISHFQNVVDTINAQNPDIILFLGDLLDDYGDFDGDTALISGALSNLSARLGKFAVYGNHDHGGGAHRVYRTIMENGGFTVLVNEYITLSDIRIRLIGLDDFVLGAGCVETIKPFLTPDYFNLVFCHVPDVVDELLDYNVHLMIAGHSHGGQINIGQVNSARHRDIFFPPYSRNHVKGKYTFENDSNTILYVNIGIGTSILPLRFLAPPTVSFITIAPVSF